MKLSEDLNELHGRLDDGDLMIPGTDWVREMADQAEALEAVAEAAPEYIKHLEYGPGSGALAQNEAMRKYHDALDRLREMEEELPS